MSKNSSCDTDDVSGYGDEIPPDIVVAAKEVSLNLLLEKSKRLYVSTYNNFKSWNISFSFKNCNVAINIHNRNNQPIF